MKERAFIHPMILLSIGIIAVSFSAIFIKWSDAPSSVIGMYRLLFTVMLMLPFILKHIEEIKFLSFKQWSMLIFSGIFLGIHFLLWIASLKYTTVASSTLLMTLQPVFAMIGGYLIYREKTNAIALISVLVAMLGTGLIGWGDFDVSSDAVFGDILAVLGTVAVAMHLLIGQKLRSNISSYVYSISVFSIAVIVFLIYNLLFHIEMIGYAGREWGIFMLLAIVPTVFGHILFNYLLKFVNATTISMGILGEPVGASILAYFLLGEMLSLYQLIGGFLAIVGVFIFIRFNKWNRKLKTNDLSDNLA